MSESSEQAFDKLKNLSKIHEKANSNVNLKEKFIESISIIQNFLKNYTLYLFLYDLKFKI